MGTSMGSFLDFYVIWEVPVYSGQHHSLDRNPEVEEKTKLAESKEERSLAFTSSDLDCGYKMSASALISLIFLRRYVTATKKQGQLPSNFPRA